MISLDEFADDMNATKIKGYQSLDEDKTLLNEPPVEYNVKRDN